MNGFISSVAGGEPPRDTPVATGGRLLDTRRLCTHARIVRALGSWKLQLAVCTLVALGLRAPTFGDPNIHIDEAWYFLVGQEMHKGALVYVDIWDRKPPFLFLIYYLIAAISHSVIAYQLVAWLFASATAFVVVRIASLWTGSVGAQLAGLAYLAAMLPLLGVGGQAPVFYNLPVALAAWCVVTSLASLRQAAVPRRVYGAMALCGLAIATKQTAIFESLFFGLFVVAVLWRAKVRNTILARFVAVACLLGAAPMLLFAIYYAALGHWPEFWHAMAKSNLSKGHWPAIAITLRVVIVIMSLALLMAAALLGRIRMLGDAATLPYRSFLSGWIMASIVGFFSVPNAYDHYALPVIVPLSVAAAAFFDRRVIGPALFALTFVYCTVHSAEWNRQRHVISAARMAHLADTIREHNRNGLFVFEGPPALYFLSHASPMTPLAFPSHFNHEIERNVSQFDTAREIRRVIALRPSVIVIDAKPRNDPPNMDSRRVVLDYIAEHCSLLDRQDVPEYKRSDTVLVYGECAPANRLR